MSIAKLGAAALLLCLAACSSPGSGSGAAYADAAGAGGQIASRPDTLCGPTNAWGQPHQIPEYCTPNSGR